MGAQGIPATKGAATLRDTRYGDQGSVFGTVDFTSPSPARTTLSSSTAVSRFSTASNCWSSCDRALSG